MNEIHSQPVKFVPPVPRCRRPIRLEGAKESLNNNFQNLQMEKKASKQKTTSNQSEKCIDPSSSYDTQVSENSTEEDEETHSPNTSSHHFQNYSVTSSPEKSNNKKSLETKQNKNSYCSNIICITLIIIVFASLFQIFRSNEVQTQSISPTLLAKSIEDIKTIFYNQESDIWNDISSAINEVISKTPKTPSIILLFAKETITMNCLAIKLAQASSAILSTTHKPLEFNPKDFGNDPGEIITTLNEYPPEKKRVMIIRDILNINVEAIKALHNLCDRVNPLVAEAIYILTMQTNNYQPSQKKLNFVEKQIFNKLSKSIDRDVLMALVTRITDGAIISVQPEPHLKYC